MKLPKHYGKCRICGKDAVLTYEHVPPKNAFNSHTVVEYSFDQVINMIGDSKRLPSDYSEIKGKYNQKGGGGYILCHSCNNNTGSWYMNEYVTFVNTLSDMIQKEGFKEETLYGFTLENLHPLRIFKAIITMMCDTNQDCLGDNNLREFLLNKESNNFDSEKYQVYAYLVTPRSNRVTGRIVLGIKNCAEPVLLSEVSHYPIGFAMYIDKPKDFEPFGVNINSLVHHTYEEKCNLVFPCMPYVNLHSKFPVDHITKDEMLKYVAASKPKNEENN